MRNPLKADYILPPANGVKPDRLIMLLHGVGANGGDLMSLADCWREHFPTAVFVAPNALEPFDEPDYPNAWQWFSLRDITPDNREGRVQQAAPYLNTFIDTQLQEYGLQDQDLMLVGFSQGTIMALYVALKRTRPCAGILGYSGRLAGAESLEPVTTKPRILLIHGTEDYVIPIAELQAAKLALEAHNVPVAALAMPGVSHRISPEGEVIGARFIQYCFSEQPERGMHPFVDAMQTETKS
jgi:phospholipase/carboxylesterase